MTKSEAYYLAVREFRNDYGIKADPECYPTLFTAYLEDAQQYLAEDS